MKQYIVWRVKCSFLVAVTMHGVITRLEGKRGNTTHQQRQIAYIIEDLPHGAFWELSNAPSNLWTAYPDKR